MLSGAHKQQRRQCAGAGNDLNKVRQTNQAEHTYWNFKLAHVTALCALCAAAAWGDVAMAQDADAKGAAPRHHSKKTVHAAKKPNTERSDHATPASAPAGGLSPQDVAIATAMAASPARLDSVYGVKGWDFPFPSYGDTLLQDYGGWRSTLAKYGFGLLEYNIQIQTVNLLNGPTNGPGPSNASQSNPNAPPSRQQYWGQRPSLTTNSQIYLTYDMSQYGVPNGQIVINGQGSWATWQHYSNNKLEIAGLTWYQTLFNKALEVKFGIIGAGASEWIGVYTGGNLASPFGPNAFIPYQMGLSQAPGVQPAARVTWHITDSVYDEFGVMRSLGIAGPSGDVFYDDAHYNPTGFRFAVPNGRPLVVDELGYKTEAGPNAPSTWLRFGAMYNTSKFTNYQTGGTTTGVGSMYFLADRELWQAAPNSPFTAYRGIYAGVTAMYAPPENNSYSQYYEARAYAIGLFDARPMDQISLIYTHNVFSRYVAALLNEFAPVTGQFGRNASNSGTFSYTARLMPGIYATAGIGYTDNPSLSYTRNEGHSLSFLASLFTVF